MDELRFSAASSLSILPPEKLPVLIFTAARFTSNQYLAICLSVLKESFDTYLPTCLLIDHSAKGKCKNLSIKLSCGDIP